MENKQINVHQTERIASVALGGAILLRSLSNLSLSRLALAGALLYRGISGHSYLYQVLGIRTASNSDTNDDTPYIEKSITVGKPAAELYQLWRDPQTLAQILSGLIEVTSETGTTQHWVVRTPFNKHVEWDTQIVAEQPGESLRWKAVEGAPVPNEVEVRFRPAPGDWGTVITLSFRFEPPAGALGSSIAQRIGMVPRLLAEKALRRFKSLAETGEIPTLRHNPAARADAYAHA